MENKIEARSQNVLFMDSDSDLVCILASFLSLQKYKVARSKNSREALFKMRNQKFDLIILDPSLSDIRFFFTGLLDFSANKNKPELLIITRDLNFHLPANLILELRGVLPKPFELVHFWKALQLKTT